MNTPRNKFFVLLSLASLFVSGCGTSAYNEKIRASMTAAPKMPAAGASADAGSTTPVSNVRPNQSLGGNRQSFLGAPLNARDRLVAQTNLKEISTAILSDELNSGKFPAQAIVDASGTPLLSWRVKLLQSLDRNLYNRFKTDEPWDSEHNIALLDRIPDYYSKGYDLETGHTAVLALVGPDTIFQPGDQVTRSAAVTDGPGDTIMIVIASSNEAVPWTKPVDLNVDPADPLKGVVGGDNTFMAAFADGSVMRVKNADPTVLSGFFTKSGGEDVRRSDLE